MLCTEQQSILYSFIIPKERTVCNTGMDPFVRFFAFFILWTFLHEFILSASLTALSEYQMKQIEIYAI